MGTNAETIAIAARPGRFTLWVAAVAALATAALILSVVALTLAARDPVITGSAGGGTQAVASTQAPLWDVGRLEAMRGRLLAEGIRVEGSATLWDPGRLDAMEGRVQAG